MVDTVQNLHQLVTVAVWLRSIKQVQLRDTRRRKVVKHAARLRVPIIINPDTIQLSDCSINNVARILRGSQQLFAGQITVVWFIDRKRGMFSQTRLRACSTASHHVTFQQRAPHAGIWPASWIHRP